MSDQQSGFVLQGAQLYVALAILAALLGISGLLVASLKHQKDIELSRVKETECLRDAHQVPDLREFPAGFKLNQDDISSLEVGDFVVAYGYPYSGDRWPGPFFEELSKTGGKNKLSVSLKITSVENSYIKGVSPCFPGQVEVPFSNLFNLYVPPY